MENLAEVQRLVATAEMAELGPGPRAGCQTVEALEGALTSAFGHAGLTEQKQQLVRAVVLLWHDHLEAAHAIVQEIDNPDGALVHGIMHRREPDYANAKYWFRRVGQHPAFGELTERTTALLDAKADRELRQVLLPRGQWDPFGFIDVCEQTLQRSSQPGQEQTLHEIQRLEMEALLNCFWR